MILAIVGYGDLGQQIKRIALSTKKYEDIIFFDDFASPDALGLYGKLNEIKEAYEQGVFDQIIIGIGYKHLDFKTTLFEQICQDNIPFATLIHSEAIVDKTAKIGEGTVINMGCLLDQNVTIGANVFVNIGSSISHDSIIESHSFIAPRVAIAGFCKIGSQNIIGINTTVIDNITTTSHVQTGGGTVLIQSIKESGVYVGNPQRKIK